MARNQRAECFLDSTQCFALWISVEGLLSFGLQTPNWVPRCSAEPTGAPCELHAERRCQNALRGLGQLNS
eukprot:scaffold121772_cov51-Phaeocystis_antarctica.AAC.2